MRNFLKIAALGAMVAGGAMSLGGTAQAASVGFNFGDVSIGFNDGYYDRDHHYHRWAHRGDAARWRREHYTQYYGWRHDDRHHRDYHYGH